MTELVDATFFVFGTGFGFVLVPWLGAGLFVSVAVCIGGAVIVGGAQDGCCSTADSVLAPFADIAVVVGGTCGCASVVGAGAAGRTVGVGLAFVGFFAGALVTFGPAGAVTVGGASGAGEGCTYAVGTGGVWGNTICVVLALNRRRNGACSTADSPTPDEQEQSQPNKHSHTSIFLHSFGNGFRLPYTFPGDSTQVYPCWNSDLASSVMYELLNSPQLNRIAMKRL